MSNLDPDIEEVPAVVDGGVNFKTVWQKWQVELRHRPVYTRSKMRSLIYVIQLTDEEAVGNPFGVREEIVDWFLGFIIACLRRIRLGMSLRDAEALIKAMIDVAGKLPMAKEPIRVAGKLAGVFVPMAQINKGILEVKDIGFDEMKALVAVGVDGIVEKARERDTE